MAWHGSTRASRLPADWAQRRTATAARAGGQCEHIDPDTGQRCPLPGCECDHVERGDDHSLTNLQWLCHDHHLAKTKQEAAAARWQYRTNRPVERHPGLR